MKCCSGFQELLSTAGEKGMSIVAGDFYGKRKFFIQARPFDPEVMRHHSKIVDGKSLWPAFTDGSGRPFPVATVIFIPIHFCPACGSGLDKMIEASPNQFDELRSQHAHLW
jgi:hypothetical protein